MRTGCIVHMGPPVVMHLCTSRKRVSAPWPLVESKYSFLEVLKAV